MCLTILHDSKQVDKIRMMKEVLRTVAIKRINRC
jgi:hypothetical protein